MPQFKFWLILALLASGCQPTQEQPHAPHSATAPSAVSTQSASDPLRPDLEFLSKKREAGIDFYASGHDPAWTLDMDFNRYFTFETQEGMRIIKPAVAMTKAADERVQRFRSVTESGELIITVISDPCQDSQSSMVLPYRTEVYHKYGKDERGTTYTGCGDYVGDYRIHDIWVLESLSGNQVQSDHFDKGLPTIEFHVNEHRVMGHDGCNEFNAKLHTYGDMIEVSQMRLTTRECGTNKPGAAMVASLTEAPLYFTYQDLTLTLHRDDKEVMQLRKVD